MTLYELRKSRNLTQQEVAERAGMSRSLYTKLETCAKPFTVTHAKALSGALGVNWLDLYGVKTCELVGALKTREAVAVVTVEPYAKKDISVDGSAVVLVVTENGNASREKL